MKRVLPFQGLDHLAIVVPDTEEALQTRRAQRRTILSDFSHP